MAIKTEIEAKINTIDDGGVNTAPEVRSVLGTDPNSLLEAVYADPTKDETTGTTTITTPNANFGYTAKFTKVGNNITISGLFTVVNTQSANSTLFTIDVAEFNASTDLYDNIGQGVDVGNENNAIRLRVIGNEFKVVSSVFAGESFTYQITYTAVS